VGLFSVRVTLRSLTQPSRQRDLDLMVDTGSLFTWVEGPLLEELGITPAETRQFRTITGSFLERKMGFALVAWDGRSGSINVVFGEPGDMSVLGATALESLTVTADPIEKTLVPTVALAL
jgi:predicted aspartyl protease